MKAQEYVGTNWESGEVQVELLRREGCRPEHKVLEIGCGCLHAAVPLVRYLDKGNYRGIDPNRWLIDSALENEKVSKLMWDKGAEFAYNDDFKADGFKMTFDFVLSHSILSHCAQWQLGLFLLHCSRVLAPEGGILASIRLADGNKFGSRGSPTKTDSYATGWTYPENTWFRHSTVCSVAMAHGFIAILRPEHTAYMITRREGEVHDWFYFRRPH